MEGVCVQLEPGKKKHARDSRVLCACCVHGASADIDSALVLSVCLAVLDAVLLVSHGPCFLPAVRSRQS
jgi:predicted metal-dependent HD superfamily phosphohydrolase